MKKLKLSSLMIVLLFITACSQEHHRSHAVPQSWYNSDEKALQSPIPAEDLDENFENNQELNQNINNILTESSVALEEGDTEAQALLSTSMAPSLSPLESKPIPNNGKPKDWVPWRAEYFMTDLSLTGSGFIGVLAFKGTSTVRAYWRKQGPKPEPNTFSQETTAQEETTNLEPVVLVNDLSTPEDMVKQLEPAVNAAVATGKIKDTPVLRKNLLKTAQEFLAIAMNIPNSTEELPWWVSRFRLDFTVDAAGRVEPVGLVGGEVRFRFEWHRIKRIVPENKKLMTAQLSEREQKLRKSLLEFITATAYDINNAFENHTRFGFKAHQIRMGLGISVKGNIGLVKGSAGVVGQIYFNRALERPKLYPIKEKSNILALTETTTAPLLLIERNPSLNTLKLAAKNKMMVETFNTDNDESNGFEEAIFRLDREKFRKGLKKAANIGTFFAKRASEAKVKSWKIYELRTAFDASISGGLDLVTLVGSATAQVSMFNENF